MKVLLTIIVSCLIITTAKSQKRALGLDLGYHKSSSGFGSIGLNYTNYNDSLTSNFSVGIEDNFSSNSFNLRLGASMTSKKFFNFPLCIGLFGIRKLSGDQNTYYVRPEIGIGGNYRIASGIMLMSLTYGYNFQLNSTDDYKNKSLVRLNASLPFAWIKRMFYFD